MSLEVNEQREHAEHAAHEADPFIGMVSITIAALAVVTAVVNSLENVETAATLTESGQAVLNQNKASDQWAYYNSKSIKKHVYALAADEAYPNADKYKKESAKEGSDAEEDKKAAEGFQEKRDESLKSMEMHEKRHHRLSAAATLLEIGIAISTVAIITRRKTWWLSAVLLGVGGSVLAAGAYLGYGLF
jgi:hypothetical protein